jgi:hypothetical protein
MRSVCFSIFALLLLGGCAAQPQKPASAEEAVKVRATAQQQARLENNFELAYKFTSPGYREAHPYKFFLGRMGTVVRRRGFEVKSVSCEGEVCSVIVDLQYSYAGLAAGAKKDTVMQRELTEKWILVDGEWWLVPDR